jgi:hypothetical protein
MRARAVLRCRHCGNLGGIGSQRCTRRSLLRSVRQDQSGNVSENRSGAGLMTYQARRTGPGTTVSYNRPSIMAHRPPVRPILPTSHGLGNLGQITGNPTIDGIIENPWFLIGAGLLVWYLGSRALQGISGKRKRRSKGISPLTIATLAAGAGAASYLWGSGAFNQL